MGDTAADLLREIDASAALAQVEGERRRCLSWTYLAWARWYAEFGASAAALDRERLAELAASGNFEDQDQDARMRMRWASALIAAAEGRDEGWTSIRSDVAVVDRFRFLEHPDPAAARQELEGLRMTTPEGKAYRSWVVTR